LIIYTLSFQHLKVLAINILNFKDKKRNHSTPLISVIVPVYNREGTIAKTLLSIQNQIFNNLEVIIVDDGSMDKTKEKIMPFLSDSRFKYVYQKHSGKPSIARNYGINISNGDWVAFLDSDDLWYIDTIKKQVDLILEAQEKKLPLELVFGDFKIKTEKSLNNKNISYFSQKKVHRNLEKCVEHKLDNGLLYNRKLFLIELYKKGFILTCAVIVKRKRLLQIGSFNVGLTYAEDTDLFLKIAESGICGSVDGFLFEYVRHENNMTESTNKIFFTDVMSVIKNHLQASSDFDIDHRHLNERYYNYHLRYSFFIAKNEALVPSLKNFIQVKPVYSFRNLKVFVKYLCILFVSCTKLNLIQK